jgi:glycosyltransferase involved in cell wall biosynthesis
MAKVSVLTSVYNAGKYLDDAIQSILKQTYSDFEFIIINDASTDESAEYLTQINDPRVKVIHNQINLGLTRSLNVGLQHITTEYVARMDADDVAHPQRLENQIRFLDNNPDYMLIGSSYRLINDESKVLDTFVKPMDHVELMWLFHSRTALEHGSVTFRYNTPALAELRYNEVYRTAQDYDFWLQLLKLGKGAITPELFLDYREHSANVTSTLSNQQITNLKSIAKDFLRDEYQLNDRESDLVGNLIEFLNSGGRCNRPDLAQSIAAITLIAKLYIDKNNLSKIESDYILRRAHGQIWKAVFAKKEITLLQKLGLPFIFPGSFYQLLQRRVLNESFLATELQFS